MQSVRAIIKVYLQRDQNKQQNYVGLNLQTKGDQEYLDSNKENFSIHNIDFPKIRLFSETIIKEAKLFFYFDIIKFCSIRSHLEESIKRNSDN